MHMSCVAALAGRLVDCDGPEVHFPPRAVPYVEQRVEEWLRRHTPNVVVASAARGADLIGLTRARELGIRCRIVLPFPVEEFRHTSVGPRIDWMRRFDVAIADAAARSDIVIIQSDARRRGAYRTVTERILQEARDLAGRGAVLALLVWDGRKRGAEDHTEYFRELALASGCAVEEIRTDVT
jgi:hypothetical protein